ncbi:MAG: hypothetical protein PCFJNLEI_03816 [Verrucomicrobiae bacterium]|nr:hypothetical protein [Verrucomicrobiae bacterium]
MKKIVLIFIALTLFVAAAILFYNRGGRAPVGAALVPESTLLFLDIPDFQASRNQFLDTPTAAFWREPEVQAFLEQPLAAWRAATGATSTTDEQRGLDQLLALPQGEVFAALTQFAATPKPRVTGIIGVDLKLRKTQALAYLKIYEHKLTKYNPTATLDKKTYYGVDYTIVRLNSQPQLCHAFLGALWVVASDEDQLRDVIARHTGHADSDTPTLAGSPRYTTALRQLPPGTAARAFVNVEELVRQFGMALLMAAQATPALQNIGNIEATAAAVKLTPTGLTDSTLITYLKDRPAEPPIARRTLTAAPADSALYSVQTTDLASVFKNLMEALARSGNPTATKMGGDFDKFLADAGVRLADDFLAHLGPEVAYIGNWRTGARAPDFAIVIEVKNRAAIGTKYATIVDILNQTTGRTDTLTHAGETLHVIHTESSYAVPTYCLTDQFFVLALTPDYAKEIITQLKSGTPALAGNTDFQQASRQVPTGGSSFTYCDLRQVIGGLYTFAHTQATNTDATALIAWNKLPQPTTIARHLGPYVSTTVENARAATTTSYSPLGKPVTLLVALAGGIAAAQPLLAQLPLDAIPGLPTMSSGRAAPPPPAGNQTAPSRTPTP